MATLRREIPEARVSRRYRILLDGLAVRLPAEKLQKLMRLGFVKNVYPSVGYTLAMNRGPSVIGGPALRAATGAGGTGVKVGVVDDGVDPRHPFLDPAGMSFPAGFPKGTPGFTTPKVIAARAFFPENSTSESRQPLDESTSFHGTFVAGVIGGVENTTAPASVPTTCVPSSGGCHGRITGLAGVAPRVHIGNYRVFSQPAPLGGCCSANTPEIIAAFEAAVADGMDVVNFSGGGPQSDPARDPMVQVVTNVVNAGVVPVISAGNDRDLFGLGTVGSPSTAPDAISVAATANSHVFTRGLALTAPVGLGQMPFVPAPGNIPSGWTTADQQIVDVGSVTGTDGAPVGRQLCASTLPAGSLAGVVALGSRGGCSFELKGRNAGQAGAIGLILADDRAGDPTAIPFNLGVPGGMISDLDGARIRQELAGSGGRGRFRVTADEHAEVSTSWAGVPTSFSSAGLTAFDHKLKPDISAPGAQIISSTMVEFAGDQYAVLDGTSFSAPHVAGAVALLLQRHPSWTPRQVKSALMTTAGPAWGDSSRTVEASVLIQGAGLANVAAADTPFLFSDPQSLAFGDLAVTASGASSSLIVALSDAGGGGGTWQVQVQPQAATAGASISVPPAVTIPPGGQTTLQITAAATSSAVGADQYGFIVLRRDGVVRRIPYGFSVTHPLLGSAQVTPLAKTQVGDTRTGTNRARMYRWPTEPFGILSLFGLEQTNIEDGAERVYSIDIPPNTVNFGAVVTDPPLDIRANIRDLLGANAPDPSVAARVARREQRPGIRRDADQHERLHARLHLQRRRDRRRPARSRPLLHRRRLRPQPVHGPAARAAICAPVVDQRRHAADGQSDHDPARHGEAEHRRQGDGREVRRRSAVAPPALQERADLGGALRPQDGRRGVSDPEGLAAAPAWPRVHADRGRRLPGGEERLDTGRRGDAEHPLPRCSLLGRSPPGRNVDHAHEGRMPAAQG